MPERRAADIGQTTLPIAPDTDRRAEKRPRVYASEIMALTTREERIAALQAVPEEWRDWVKFYVQSWFARKKR